LRLDQKQRHIPYIHTRISKPRHSTEVEVVTPFRHVVCGFGCEVISGSVCARLRRSIFDLMTAKSDCAEIAGRPVGPVIRLLRANGFLFASTMTLRRFPP
tara:strand:+ start:155914 stop:156213 length:300 start_codon:yes stop_codon:yes gene_type:complete